MTSSIFACTRPQGCSRGARAVLHPYNFLNSDFSPEVVTACSAEYCKITADDLTTLPMCTENKIAWYIYLLYSCSYTQVRISHALAVR